MGVTTKPASATPEEPDEPLPLELELLAVVVTDPLLPDDEPLLDDEVLEEDKPLEDDEPLDDVLLEEVELPEAALLLDALPEEDPLEDDELPENEPVDEDDDELREEDELPELEAPELPPSGLEDEPQAARPLATMAKTATTIRRGMSPPGQAGMVSSRCQGQAASKRIRWITAADAYEQ